MSHDKLVKELIADKVLKTPVIIEAFKSIDRADFVPEELKEGAYINAPLPIGSEQTISQPLTVAFMLELLQPKAGEKIIDVGSGSGWQTALLAHIVSSGGAKGKVFAIEIIPALCEAGTDNVSKYDYIKSRIVKMYCQNAASGLPEEAPVDGIIAAASLRRLPSAWKEQLKVGGRIVAPVGWSVVKMTKVDDNKFDREEYPGFLFVPFVQ